MLILTFSFLIDLHSQDGISSICNKCGENEKKKPFKKRKIRAEVIDCNCSILRLEPNTTDPNPAEHHHQNQSGSKIQISGN
jgi:hypothetical protein